MKSANGILLCFNLSHYLAHSFIFDRSVVDLQVFEIIEEASTYLVWKNHSLRNLDSQIDFAMPDRMVIFRSCVDMVSAHDMVSHSLALQ